jgi:hypothetical protein
MGGRICAPCRRPPPSSTCGLPSRYKAMSPSVALHRPHPRQLLLNDSTVLYAEACLPPFLFFACHRYNPLVGHSFPLALFDTIRWSPLPNTLLSLRTKTKQSPTHNPTIPTIHKPYTHPPNIHTNFQPQCLPLPLSLLLASSSRPHWLHPLPVVPWWSAPTRSLAATAPPTRVGPPSLNGSHLMLSGECWRSDLISSLYLHLAGLTMNPP